jgi:ribonuclease HI
VACYGYVARRGGQVVASGWGVNAQGPQATSNVAEYAAAIYALRALLDPGLSSRAVEMRSDSQLLVNQMRGIFAVRSLRIAGLHRELQQLARRFPHLQWRWAPREENTEADALSRRAYAEAVLAEKAQGLQVELLEGGALRVQSSTGSGWYRVTLDPQGCECPVFRGGMRPCCKHIVAARQ